MADVNFYNARSFRSTFFQPRAGAAETLGINRRVGNSEERDTRDHDDRGAEPHLFCAKTFRSFFAPLGAGGNRPVFRFLNAGTA